MVRSVQPIPTVTAEQMREVDRLMVEIYGISLLQMMELAGRAHADFVRLHLGGTVAGKSIVVAAGHGNNGGGGLAAARQLSNYGAVVTVLMESAQRFPEIPRRRAALMGCGND